MTTTPARPKATPPPPIPAATTRRPPTRTCPPLPTAARAPQTDRPTEGRIDSATDAALVDSATDAALPAFVGVADFNLARKCTADGPPADTYFFGFYQETPTDAGAGGTCQSMPINAACVYTTCTGQPSATTTLTAVPLNAGTVSIFEYEQDGGSDSTDGGPVRSEGSAKREGPRRRSTLVDRRRARAGEAGGRGRADVPAGAAALSVD